MGATPAFLLWTSVARPSQIDDERLILVFLQKSVAYIRDSVRQKARLPSATYPGCVHFPFCHVLKWDNGCQGCMEIIDIRRFPCRVFLICMHHICLNILSVGKVQLFGTKLLMINRMSTVSAFVNPCGAGETPGNRQDARNKRKHILYRIAWWGILLRHLPCSNDKL